MMMLGLVAPVNAAMSDPCRIEVEDSIVFPANEGERASYKAFIKTGRGEISGVCLLLHEGDTIKGAIVNEFGISALDFTYVMSADRMTLNHVIAMLDKWYVRAVIKEDLRQVLLGLQQGKNHYDDERYHISYTLTPIIDNTDNKAKDDTEEPTLPD